MRPPLTFEALAIVFFAAVCVATPFTRATRVRQFRAALLSAGLTVGIAAAAWTLGPEIRIWLGHAYLVAGYWIPALLVPTGPAEAGPYLQGDNVGQGLWGPSAFEAWLIRCDERWCRFTVAPPVWTIPILELSYLLCYVMVPVAFVLVWANGALADVDHFWTAVLLSGFLCYGSLPWLISRPPRLVDAKTRTTRTAVRTVNEFVLTRVSHGLNTFPSGHVAVSLAAALEVLSVSQAAGIALLLIAAAIAVGAVAGRYHYAVDVVLGLAVGAAASTLV